MEKDYGSQKRNTKWILTSWLEKLIYIIGWVTVLYSGLAFLIGLIQGLLFY